MPIVWSHEVITKHYIPSQHPSLGFYHQNWANDILRYWVNLIKWLNRQAWKVEKLSIHLKSTIWAIADQLSSYNSDNVSTLIQLRMKWMTELIKSLLFLLILPTNGNLVCWFKYKYKPLNYFIKSHSDNNVLWSFKFINIFEIKMFLTCQSPDPSNPYVFNITKCAHTD